MKKRPIVSIVIAIKNEEKNILDCIRSIKKQQGSKNIEIIIVDNYSKDKSIEIAKPYVDKIVVSGPERSSQKNLGAKSAAAAWLLFLDADMRLSKKIISECFEFTRLSYFPPIIALNEEAKGSSFWGKALALERRTYKSSPSWIVAARFFPKHLFLKLGGFDKNLVAGEDWDLTQRFLKAGVPMFLTKKSTIIHNESELPLWELLKKEAYYIRNIGKYAKKQPLAFSYQQSLLYRGFVWTRAWRILVKEPVLTVAFLFYKFIVWCMWLVRKNNIFS